MSDPLTQARDRIAELCGWYRWEDVNEFGQQTGWIRDGRQLIDPSHPIPACLNFVSRVWPEWWRWRRDYEHPWDDQHLTRFFWVVWQDTAWSVCIDDTGDELADRMTLLADVLAWLQSNDPSAFAAAIEKIRKEIRG